MKRLRLLSIVFLLPWQAVLFLASWILQGNRVEFWSIAFALLFLGPVVAALISFVSVRTALYVGVLAFVSQLSIALVFAAKNYSIDSDLYWAMRIGVQMFLPSLLFLTILLFESRKTSFSGAS